MKIGFCTAVAMATGYGCVKAGLPDWMTLAILIVFAVAAFVPEFVDGLQI